MFSYIFGSKKGVAPASASHPSKHRASRSRDVTWQGQGQGQATDGDYDDVSLEGGPTGQPGASRQSFSAPTATRGSFVGGAEDATSASNKTPYPPLPSFSRPSTTNGYPSLRTTFDRLSTVLAEQSPSLLDSLSPPLSSQDPALASLLHAISPYHLPPAVLESYALHDGQDPFSGGGASTAGLVWGLWWMPIDQVEQEWKFWRRFENAGGGQGMADAFSASTEGAKMRTRAHPYVEDQQGEEEDGGGGTSMHGMTSFPEGWVRKRYSHPGWLPLLSDRCGNYIGIDLDPPPPLPSSSSTASGGRSGRAYGQPGQVIAFGREIDEKVVLFPGDGAGGWGRFLASFVDDLEKGEFARLGEGDEIKRLGANGWADEESSGGGSPKSDEWEAGDGIGDRSYFEGDRYGDEGDEGAAIETQAWVLRPEYRKELSPDSNGGLIGLIAERSRRKWKSLGVGSRASVPASFPEPRARAPLSVAIPPSVDEAGPSSSVTVRPASPDLMSTESARPSVDDLALGEPVDGTPTPEQSSSQDGLPPPVAGGNVEVVLSPPSPTRAGRSVNLSTPAKDKFSIPPAPKSPELLDDGRPAHGSRGLHDKRRKSRKAPPPPPAALDLPTMLDLDEESTERVYGNGSPSTHHLDQFDEPRRGSNSSIRSYVATTPTRDTLLPTHSSNSVPMMHNTGDVGSTVALVDHQEVDMTANLSGLGIDSPELDRHRMEVVVDHNRPTSPALSAHSRVASPALSDQPYEMASETPRD